MAKYEILYIIRPNIEEEAKNALVARFDSILTDNGATVVSQDRVKACYQSVFSFFFNVWTNNIKNFVFSH